MRPDPSFVRKQAKKPAAPHLQKSEFRKIIDAVISVESLSPRKRPGIVNRLGWQALAAGAICIPLLGNTAVAADAVAPTAPSVTQSQGGRDDSAALRAEIESLRNEVRDVASLRKEVKELREQLKAGSSATLTNVFSAPVASQDDLNGVRSDVQTLRDQLNRSIDSATVSPNNVKLVTAQRALAVTGTIQVGAQVTDNNNKPLLGSNPTVSGGGAKVPGVAVDPQGFKVNNLILGFTGLLWKDYDQGRNITYLASLQANSPAKSDFSIVPQDVYLNFNVLPTINPEDPTLGIQVGQEVKQFGVEATAGEAYVTTINRAGFVAGLGLGRDVGAVAIGTAFVHDDFGANWRIPLVQYSAGVFNGSGQNALNYGQTVAPNARLVLNAPVDYNSLWRGLSVGGSYYGGYATNSYYANGKPYTLDNSLYGADISWVHSPFGFTAEYVYGNKQIQDSAAAVVRTTHPYGYVFTLFYQWGEKFEQDYSNQDRFGDWFPKTYQPFIRYERYYDDALYKTGPTSLANAQDIYTIGFNWFFARTTKLQLNYRYVNNSFNLPKTENQYLAQFQFGF